MKLKRILIGTAAVAFLALGSSVLSQTISVPQVSVINPTDLIQVLPFGRPVTGNVYATAAQITSQSGYYKSTPPNKFTFTFSNTQTFAAFTPSGTLDYGYVTLAPAPSDGAQECVFSTAAISTLYLSANTGQTIVNAVTTLAANARVCYLYSASNLTWNRSQ